jgi:hypothetical protein
VGGACRSAALADVNGDRRLDVIASEAEPPALVWYAAPRWTRRTIEPGVEAFDLLPAALAGRRGVLLVHKRSQLRFYAIPPRPAGAWPARDLYSIYTPAWQGGLALADIDRDGRTDILCGNYWLRAPAAFELPWRLFAINEWTDQERSGVMRVAAAGGSLAAAQRELEKGRAALFDPPADPREQWIARDLGQWDRPDSLAAADFNRDGRIDVLLGERGPSGRVVIFESPGYAARVLRQGAPVVTLWVVARGGAAREVYLLTEDALERGSVPGAGLSDAR